MRRTFEPKVRLLCFIAALMIGMSAPKLAEAAKPSVNGYLKSYSSMYKFPRFAPGSISIDPPALGAVSNRLRLKSRWPCLDWLTLSAAYDVESRVQDFALLTTSASGGMVGRVYRIADLGSRLYPGAGNPIGSFGVFQNLDRAQAELRVSSFDIYIGRQAISWGSAHVVNPTDILTTFSFTSLDTEDRVGVDAIRARLALSFMSELDVGVVAGPDFEPKSSAAFVRYKTYWEMTDLTWIVAGFREHLLAGFDATRSIGAAGSWLEVAYVWPKLLQRHACPRPDGYLRASLGMDYNLGANTYGFVEYHFNQAGSGDPANYILLSTTPAYVDGAVYLLGKHYLVPGITHQVTPLVSATAEVLGNLSDQSAYIALSVEYNVAEDVYLEAGSYLGFGPGPKSPLQLNSEFGSYPDTFYSSFRYYF